MGMPPWGWALIGAGAVVLLAAIAAGGWLAWRWLRRAKPGKASAEAPPLGAELQDPLPESNWLWRRVLFLASAVVLTAIVAYGVYSIGQLGKSAPAAAIAGLVQVCTVVLVALIVDRILYTIAPSGEQLVKMANIVSLLKGGVSIFSRAEARTPEGSATSTVEAGPPAAKPARPADTSTNSPEK